MGHGSGNESDAHAYHENPAPRYIRCLSLQQM